MFKSEIISLKFQILFAKLFCVSFLASVVCIYADKCIYLLLTISSQFMLVKQKTKNKNTNNASIFMSVYRHNHRK